MDCGSYLVHITVIIESKPQVYFLTFYLVFLNLLTSQFLLVISASSSPWLPCRLLEGVGSSLHNSVSRSTSTKFRSLICENTKKIRYHSEWRFSGKKTTQFVIVFNILLVFSATALTYKFYQCHNIKLLATAIWLMLSTDLFRKKKMRMFV